MKSIATITAFFCCLGALSHGAELTAPRELVNRFCAECHTEGGNEGSLDLDAMLAVADPATELAKWTAVWKNLRAELMPPNDQPQPSKEERRQLEHWIEQAVFKIDPQRPDPGRVTVRRLNRFEYRNTIQDMLGVDFNTDDAFPADDAGYGFDNIGDVLSLSPLQVEKYLEAARTITGKAVPTSGPSAPTVSAYPDNFRDPKNEKQTARSIPIRSTPVVVERKQWLDHPGPYAARLEYRVSGADAATMHEGELVVRVGEQEVLKKKLTWDTSSSLSVSFQAKFAKGHNPISLELLQTQPPRDGEPQIAFDMRKLDLHGPTDGSYLQYPPGYDRVFFRGPPPQEAAAREAYAREILQRLADRAFRRPVDRDTIDRLMELVKLFDQPGEPQGFEKGIAEAATAILASPRFLFRAEFQPEPDNRGKVVPVDEYALASRLSYFLWSSLPDDELFALAREGKLREQLRPQVDRMLADKKSDRFVRNFVGQWLRTRDVEAINIDARRILGLRRTEDAQAIFTRNLRRSMREETERMFAYILAENRPVLDLLSADYTFLNEVLANWYGIEGVKGNDLQKVSLPAGSPRGSILAHASFLLVTSNPTRTSPVKRGLFVLENLLGAPAPPPPPNVPELEAVRERGKKLSMRELMEIHRAEPLCASCHARMDPLGLALEEFDALGRWRNEEGGEPIDTAGRLITGEKFANVRELSQVLATERKADFYACLTEKLLTYALGRGVEYYDAPAIDRIVEQLDHDAGHIRTMIYGVVESVPFQQRRGDGNG